jgi:hypothetical protein
LNGAEFIYSIVKPNAGEAVFEDRKFAEHREFSLEGISQTDKGKKFEGKGKDRNAEVT